MLKYFIKKYRKEDNKFEKFSRLIPSFCSSLFAGLFVATGFLFVTYFIPFGQSGWIWSWINLTFWIIVFCFVYYFIGLYVIFTMNPKEIKGYKLNFLASLIGTTYISIIILLKLKPLIVIISTVILSFVTFFVGHKIVSKKPSRKKFSPNEKSK